MNSKADRPGQGGRSDAPSLGGDSARREPPCDRAAALPEDVRACPEPVALQVLQRAVQRAVRGSAQVGRVLPVREEPEYLRALNRVGTERWGGRPAERALRRRARLHQTD
jgi:hypothetical protein